MNSDLLMLVTFILTGCVIGLLILRIKEKGKMNGQQNLLSKENELAVVKEKNIMLERENAILQERNHHFIEEQKQYQALRQEYNDLKMQFAQINSDLIAKKEQLHHQTTSEKTLIQHFENLSEKIFKEKTEYFSEVNKESIKNLLTPFREKIDDFKNRIESIYSEENKERRSLQNEVKNLVTMNKALTDEAAHLTEALKGNKKLQGDWGELVLKRILEESGLRKNHEYNEQLSLSTEEGDRQKPDIIVYLPDEKQVIIDAKVSLVDYSRYHSLQEGEEKNQALKKHVKAIQNHIQALSNKNYQKLLGAKTLDYVLMFIPIEPAFYLAIEKNTELFQNAMKKNILLVSPTNLLVTLKTIHYIWSCELQNKNTEKIIAKAASLYDKLQGVTQDLQKIDHHILSLRKTYDDAMKKFITGRGNILKQANDLIEMKVPAKKRIEAELTDQAIASDRQKNKESTPLI